MVVAWAQLELVFSKRKNDAAKVVMAASLTDSNPFELRLILVMVSCRSPEKEQPR